MKGGERGERTTRVKGANEGREQAAGRRSARTRRGEEEKSTHTYLIFESWPITSGIVPLIWLLPKALRMRARKECNGGRAR